MYFSPSQVNLPYLERHTDLPVISISAKMGTNLQELLQVIKEVYDKNVKTEDEKSVD
jgi:translation initiation factor IF-2